MLLVRRGAGALCGARSGALPRRRAYSHIAVQQRGSALWVEMDRPALHNAFNEDLIAELTAAFGAVAESSCRSVVLSGGKVGKGHSFSAGADLSWMQRMATYTQEQNREDSLRLFAMFNAIAACPVPVIARVNGAALGGGSGLVACSDMAAAVDSAVFGFTEVKLGLIPAVISPFVMRKIGFAGCSRFFLTGERFATAAAVQAGLVQAACADEAALDAQVAAWVKEVEQNSPAAVRACKRLIAHVHGADAANPSFHRDHVTAEIARARVSAEGQEGLAAFFQKRKPSFVRKWEQ